MKKYIIGIVLLFFAGTTVFAQSNEDRPRPRQKEMRAKMEAQRIAYITKRLELTPEEATNFWPLYNEFEVEKKKIEQKHRRGKKVVDMTDAELEKFMASTFERDQARLDLKKTYFEKFKKTLPIRKIVMLQIAEREFKSTIIDTLKDKRKERRKQRQGMQGN